MKFFTVSTYVSLLFLLKGVALAYRHDVLFPISCVQDCGASIDTVDLDFVKGHINVTTTSLVGLYPKFSLNGPAMVNIHAGFESENVGSCSDGYAMFVGELDQSYAQLCKGVDGSEAGDFTREVVVEVADLNVRGGEGSFSFSFQLQPGATWIETGKEYTSLDVDVNQQYLWKSREDVLSADSQFSSILAVWGPAEIELVEVDILNNTGSRINLRNGDWETVRDVVQTNVSSYTIYLPTGLNHIEYLGDTEWQMSEGFDMRIRPAKPLIEVMEESPQDGVIAMHMLDPPFYGKAESWMYRDCQLVKTKEYSANESAKLKIQYNAEIFSIIADLDHDVSLGEECEDDYILIGGLKFCYCVTPEFASGSTNSSIPHYTAPAGDLVDYFSNDDRKYEGEGWSFIICPRCQNCDYNFSPDIIQVDSGADFFNFSKSLDGQTMTVSSSNYSQSLDVLITVLEDVEIDVEENDFERGSDGSNEADGPCEDDYILIKDERMCINHDRLGKKVLKKGETMKLSTDSTDDGSVSSHKLKLTIRSSPS